MQQQLKCSMMIMGRIHRHRIVNAPLADDYSSLYDFQNVMFVVVYKAIDDRTRCLKTFMAEGGGEGYER